MNNKQVKIGNGYLCAQILVAALLAGLYGSSLPFALWDIKVGEESISFSLNMLFVVGITLFIFPCLFKGWDFAMHKEGIVRGITKYGMGMILGALIIGIGTFIDAYPFDKSVSIWHLVSQCLIVYMLVGLIEEVLLRGCVFNALIIRFGDNKKGVLIAIIGSSILFSLMHLVGAPSDMSLLLEKLLWTFCGGMSFAIMYYLSKNLWCGIIMHGLIDMMALPSFLSTQDLDTTGSFSTLLASVVMLAFSGVFLIRDFKNKIK